MRKGSPAELMRDHKGTRGGTNVRVFQITVSAWQIIKPSEGASSHYWDSTSPRAANRWDIGICASQFIWDDGENIRRESAQKWNTSNHARFWRKKDRR